MSGGHDDNSLEELLDAQSSEPFSELERKRLRKLLQDDDRATWLRRQIRVLTPWTFAVVGAVYGAWNYLSAHWKAA
jgi:hypothetical protein